MGGKNENSQDVVFHSDLNDRLIVTWEEGRKVLNSENTNYSYGGLQEVLNRGLRQIPIDNINSVLVLGMGAGSIVDSLRGEFNYQGPITGIEIDPVVIEIAEKEFTSVGFENVKWVQADAIEYVAESKDKFDLIVVDIFVDAKVPKGIYDASFWRNIESLVADNKFVLFNAGIDLPEDKMYNFIDVVPESFIYQKKLNVLVSNTVFIFQKIF